MTFAAEPITDNRDGDGPEWWQACETTDLQPYSASLATLRSMEWRTATMHYSAPRQLETLQVSSHESDPGSPSSRGVESSSPERWLSSLSVDRIAAEPDIVRAAEPDADWCAVHWPRNAHHVVCFAASGTSHGTVGRERVVLGSGGVLWAHPGTPLRLWAGERGPALVHRLLLTYEPAVDVFTESFLLADGVWEAKELLAQLSRELGSGPSVVLREERVRGLLTVLFTSVLRAASFRDAPGLLSRPAQQMITELADRRIHERLRAADLADAVGLTPDYFTRIFRRTFGMPPREWLMHRRVRHGAWALDTSDSSVAQIARALGYPDPFLFSRQFKIVMGVPPQTYRRRQEYDSGMAATAQELVRSRISESRNLDYRAVRSPQVTLERRL